MLIHTRAHAHRRTQSLTVGHTNFLSVFCLHSEMMNDPNLQYKCVCVFVCLRERERDNICLLIGYKHPNTRLGNDHSLVSLGSL